MLEFAGYRIVEETSVRADGSSRVEFQLQARLVAYPKEWIPFGSSPTRDGARIKAALAFHSAVAPERHTGAVFIPAGFKI